MKKGLLFSALAGVAIIVAAAFGLHLITPAAHNLPDSLSGAVLFVCPAASYTFDPIAKQLGLIRNGLTIAFFFVFMILAAGAGWALYQNLIEDKFKEKNWETIVVLGKWLFWITIAVTLALHTPNHFRRVYLKGAAGEYVLCEESDPASIPVHASAVRVRL